jgi:hypothetical protein
MKQVALCEAETGIKVGEMLANSRSPMFEIGMSMICRLGHH